MLRSLVVAAALWLACTGSLSAQSAKLEPSAAPAAAPARAMDRVVLLTIDGLRPVDCARFPTLSKIAKAGAAAATAEGALSVMPSVTYPAHTSMVTGDYPARHGITTNQAADPTPENKNMGGWRWYAQDIRVPTLWGAAFDAGLKTALITFPVTVGARATVNLPEYWRANIHEDAKLLRALATPGFAEILDKEVPEFTQDFSNAREHDGVTIGAALSALAHYQPQLLLLHIWYSDDAQHGYGPDSPEASEALRAADQQLARLLTALEHTPEWPRTALIVASDHGFARIDRTVLPLVALEANDLGSQLWLNASGGLAYLYLQAGANASAVDKAKKLFTKLASDPNNGIARVLTRAEIAKEHGDPDAALALEARIGFAFRKKSGDALVAPSGEHGVHGYLPERPEMRATLIVYGPHIKPGVLHGARLIDIAPTAAQWLGLSLPNTDGKPLPIQLSK
jgi:predicted AlkP superfamily pyrophosphatase or phosphodiesterase